jgi:hypothetical protein
MATVDDRRNLSDGASLVPTGAPAGQVVGDTFAEWVAPSVTLDTFTGDWLRPVEDREE